MLLLLLLLLLLFLTNKIFIKSHNIYAHKLLVKFAMTRRIK